MGFIEGLIAAAITPPAMKKLVDLSNDVAALYGEVQERKRRDYERVLANKHDQISGMACMALLCSVCCGSTETCDIVI